MRRRSEKYVIEGSKYAHWIGLYLGFHLNWVLGPFVQGRLQNLQTNEVTFAHVITPLSSSFYPFSWFQDMDQFGIAPRHIQTSQKYIQKEQTTQRAAWDPVVTGISDALTDIIKPVQ